jgi:DNA-binding CsgD family transcriptional regulator
MGRQLHSRETEALVVKLRDEGFSYAKIGDTLGISKSSARDIHYRSMGISPRGGRGSGSPRLTPEEKARRRAAVARLFREGYTMEKIGQALGISPSSAANDVQALGLDRRGRRPTSTLRQDAPAPVDWRDGFPGQGLAYPTSMVVTDAHRWIEGFNSGDYPNRFAWNIDEAMRHGDYAWVRKAEQLIELVHETSGRLVRILHDERYREECKRGSGAVRTHHTDTPRLRAVR